MPSAQIRWYVQWTETEISRNTLLIFMKFRFFLKSLTQEKLIQEMKVRFIKGNELKLTQVELLSFFIFKSVIYGASP